MPSLRKSLILIFTLMTFAELSFAQRIIRGKILDINTRQPIAYVNIFLQTSRIGTSSDFAGRFLIQVPQGDSAKTIIFQHINYDKKIIPLSELQSPLTIHLQPRIIPLPGVEISAFGEKFDIQKDLPLIVTEIKARQFEARGFVDAGDFLRSDESIQVQESLSGGKTISLRGGNPDDVLILYNGVKLNNQFSNIFDISLIDMENAGSLQIIKGSNSVLYGSGAFSGVVNIVPQIEHDFFIRFQQRIGSYDSGNWGVQLYGNKGNLHATYSVRQGGSKRIFSDGVPDQDFLENQSFHQSAGLEYRFGGKNSAIAENSLKIIGLSSTLKYTNHRENESVDQTNEVGQVLYRGKLGSMNDFGLSAAFHRSEETQALQNQSGLLERHLSTESIQLHSEKTIKFRATKLFINYQFEQNNLNFSEVHRDIYRNQFNGELDELQRTQHSLASVLKILAPGGSNFLKSVNFDLSYRLDLVYDRSVQNKNSVSVIRDIPDCNWNNSVLKFASRFHGYYQRFLLDIFMNIGNNVKLPTLAQLISADIVNQQTGNSSVLVSETNHSVEIGAILKRDLRDHPTIYGWEVSLSYMKNHYSDKLRPYYVVGLPLAFYDNVPDARIAGFETKAAVFLFKKKITAETGISRYSISEKAAFPFKSESKEIVNLSLDHAGYSFLAHWFHESEQIGWVRQVNGDFIEVVLPRFINLDLHFSKTFTLKKFKIFSNLSLRNLLNDDSELLGLALHDRRYYFTVGIQY